MSSVTYQIPYHPATPIANRVDLLVARRELQRNARDLRDQCDQLEDDLAGAALPWDREWLARCFINQGKALKAIGYELVANARQLGDVAGADALERYLGAAPQSTDGKAA